MEAIVTRLAPDEEGESCAVPGCTRPAAYHLVKIRDNNSEEESFFCASHGDEYMRRGHLGIAENT